MWNRLWYIHGFWAHGGWFTRRLDFQSYKWKPILHCTKIEVCRSNQLKTVHNYYVLYQILITLQYIHSKDIIHRDIKVERFTSDCFLKNLFKKKPSNILINQDCQIKLADFGLARGIFCKQTQRYACDLTSYVATRWYATQWKNLLIKNHQKE